MAGRDLTQGAVARWIPALTFPMMLTFGMQSAYALADLYFVSRLGGAALAGLGISLNTYFIVLAVGQAIGVGGLALLSQAFGAGRHDRVSQVFQQVLWLMLALGTVLWIVGWVNAERFILLFSEDANVVREGTAFMRAYSASFLFQVLLMAGAMCFRALGDFVLPTVISAVTVVLNVVLDPLLIFGWGPLSGLGIAGAGLATAIGQGVGVLAYAAMILFHPRTRALVVGLPLRWDWAIQRQVLRIGIPAGLRFLMLGTTLLVFFRFLRPLGGDAAAATGLGIRVVSSLLLLLGDSVGTAVASLVGQNFGAGKSGRVKAAIRWGLAWHAVCFGVIFALILWDARLWVAPFAQEPDIVALAARYMVILGSALPFFGVSMITSYASGGLGRTFPPMLAMSVNLIFCLAGWTVLRYSEALTLDGMWIVAAAALDVEALVLAVVLVRIWKQLPPESIAENAMA